MKTLLQLLAVGGAGFAGAVARWLISLGFGRWMPIRFPIGTLFINVSGSFFLGWFVTFITFRYPVPDTLRLAIATGFVGAYTTFSTYMLESNELLSQGAAYEAWINLIGSLVLGLIAVRLGAALGQRSL